MRALHLEEARHRGGERQALGIGGVDAADERIGDALERLASEAAADERRQALVAGRRAGAAARGRAPCAASRPGEERRASRAARGRSAPAAGSPRAAGAGGRRARRTCGGRPRACRSGGRRSRGARRAPVAHGFSVMNESGPRSSGEAAGALGGDACRRAGSGLEQDDVDRRARRARARPGGAPRRGRRCRRRRPRCVAASGSPGGASRDHARRACG